MRQDQFVAILHCLRLGPASKRAAEAFGLSLRQLQRITSGKSPVPGPVALLAIAYTIHGLPDPLWNPDVSRQDALEDLNARITRTMELNKLFQNPAAATPGPDPEDLVAAVRTAKVAREEKAASVRMKRLRW
jgi:hypothetical protein